MNVKKTRHPEAERVAKATRAKKAYEAPRLVTYGNLARLTATGSGSMPGDATNMMP